MKCELNIKTRLERNPQWGIILYKGFRQGKPYFYLTPAFPFE